MRLTEGGVGQIFQLTDRRKLDSANLEQLVKGILSGIEELDQRNKELVEKNAELEAALKQSREREASLEEAFARQSESIAAALNGLAETAARAEEAVGALQRRGGSDGLQRYSEASRRILDLQKDVLAQLEQARDELVRREQALDVHSADALRDLRRALTVMATEVHGGRLRSLASDPLGGGDRRLADAPLIDMDTYVPKEG